MNERVNGLILSQQDYKEADVILRVLTKEYGKISLIASGIRKMTSKNAGSVFPYTESELSFDWRPDRSMFRLKTARNVNLFRHMHEDIVQSAAAALLSEIADAMSYEGQQDDTPEEKYELLWTAYKALEEGVNGDLVIALYTADMMRCYGIEPDVDECVQCGRTQVRAISAKHGGFLCEECAIAAGVPFAESAQLKQFRLIVKGGITHLEIIRPLVEDASYDCSILLDMLRLHAGLHLKSAEFYERIR